MSIRVRLTVMYVLLLAVVLIIFSATFYGILSISLNAEMNSTLQSRARQVINGFQAANTPISVIINRGFLPPELDLFSTPSVFIQVTQPDGALVTRSDNLDEYRLPSTAEMLDTINNGEPFMTDTEVGGVELRIFSTPIIVNESVIGIVQVGQPLTSMKATLRRVLLSLVGGSVLAIIIAALTGVALAQISLRPIDRITMTANKIVSAEDLGQRLPVTGMNDEVDRLSQTINGMLARLDNFFQAQSRLSADISHELRTPLTIIRGNVDLLRNESPKLVGEQEETLGAINSALDRMARIVSDLLILSQADAGMSLTMHPIELELLILDVFHEAHAIRKGVSLSLGHTEPCQVHGDEDRLKQLLVNLIHNAIKHTPTGGRVTISLYKEDDVARISVADTGTGIAPEDLPYIFDRFYRAKDQNRKGSGLGLAIAEWIAQAHRGTLAAESQMGNGSTFVLRLPLLEKDEEVDTSDEAEDTLETVKASALGG